MSYTVSFREGFLAELLALGAKEQAQINGKLKLLLEDPRPDGATKKQLKHINRDVCRLRSGDFRIFYTFDDRFVSLLKVVRRSEDTYEGDLDAEYFGGPAEQASPQAVTMAAHQPVPSEGVVDPGGTPRSLPEKLTPELLARLRVPTAHHAALARVEDEDGLLACAGVPDDVLLRVHQALFDRGLDAALEEKEFVAADVDDLLRYRDGDLLGFLLRLSAEQERVVGWALDAAGPTLVKGGPGTGKSTVALYRVRAMLQALRRSGVARPRILFTTYTNALVTFSEQLLRSLLGPDADCVEVRTADSLVHEIVRGRAGVQRVASQAELREAMQKAMAAGRPAGSSLERRARVEPLARLGPDYLIDEVSTVIEARRIETLEAYLAAARPGRRAGLTADQRTQVWAVREAFNRELTRRGRITFQQLRSWAARIVAQGAGPAPYDGVVVDEAQDLDPSVLWLLVSLAKQPNRVFLTADANQSIYGAGFRWSDVHEQLNFKGRTSVLRANFRSTREIGEAALAYLGGGQLDDDAPQPEYMHAGPLPVMRRVGTGPAEQNLIVRFVREAARSIRLPIWATAVLVPTEKAGQQLASTLAYAGLPASYMTGRDLDLSAQTVKVITLRSAKGLEFPVVVLAGFENPYPYARPGTDDAEKDERMAQERRTLFVGMTRAMRALLLAVHEDVQSDLLTGFPPELWNVHEASA
ncbi:MAG: UvrD-helicase domain-containing protein [Vicinamibacterales bacterium]